MRDDAAELRRARRVAFAYNELASFRGGIGVDSAGGEGG